MNNLRACGGCGGSFLADNRNEIYFCPKCTAKLPEFNPQPYAKCEGRPDRQRVRMYGDRREWVVCERDGNDVTVKPLGGADESRITVQLSRLRPPYYTPGR